MELTVYWTQFAEDKLLDIFNYYKNKAGKRIARKLIIGIVDRSIELEKNPFIGQKEPLLVERKEDFRYLIYKNYKIIYWVNEVQKSIMIANVFDCRQNPEKMKEFK